MEEELSCPICWVSYPSSSMDGPTLDSSSSSSVEFLKSPCGHVACSTCMERLLLSTEPLHDFLRRRYLTNDRDDTNPSLVYEQAMDDIVSSCPSKGRCPICRENIDLFDLQPIITCNTSEVDGGLVPCRSTNLEKNTILDTFPVYDTIYLPKTNAFLDDSSSFTFHFMPMGGSSTQVTPCPFIRFENTSKNVRKDQPFEPGFFFFPKSNTFHGKIDWTKSVSNDFCDNSIEWEVIIQFPSDYRCFSGGAIIQHKSSTILGPYLKESKVESCSMVTNSQEKCPPRVDFLGPRGYSFHRLKKTTFLDVNPTYNRLDVWGNTFIQSDKLGFASYHFDIVSRIAYISYEHDDTCYWPPLDDGSPIPSRVPFINTSYDAEARTFRGQIAWKQIYHTTWNGSETWDYQMKFDTEFTCILSGTVYSMHNGQSTELSEYGQSLIYVNAALKQALAERLSLTEDHSMQGVRTVALTLVHRLGDEGAPVRTIATVSSAVNRASMELFQSAES